jgi:hypothetical protein
MQRTSFVLTLVAVAACASGSGGRPAALEREPGQPTVSVSITRRGTFGNMLSSSAQVQGGVQIRTSGSVTVYSSGEGNRQTRVRLEITLPFTNEQFPWAIAPGSCGNGAITIAPVSKFGAIDVGSTGGGSVDLDLAVALVKREQYHVEVYRSGQTLADVIACANLKIVD